MSSISAMGLSVSPFAQNVTGPTNITSAQTTASATNAGTTDPTSVAQLQGQGHHHRHQGGAFAQIQQAVTSALSSAQSDGSSDPNQIIQNAITKVLQQANGSAGNGTTDPDGDGDTSEAGNTTNASTTNQSFTQMLRSIGVSRQQFHADFLAAVKAAQEGQSNPSTAFQSFPPGSTIDTVG